MNITHSSHNNIPNYITHSRTFYYTYMSIKYFLVNISDTKPPSPQAHINISQTHPISDPKVEVEVY